MEVIKLTGKIRGAAEVRRMFAIAPELMTTTVRMWFYSIRKKFVGKKGGKPGSYPRWLARKRLKGRDGSWSAQAAGAFKGFLRAYNRIEAMTLVMGVPQKHQKGFVRGLEMMNSGGGSVTSSKYMPIPNYKNLGSGKKAYSRFRSMCAANDLVPIRTRGGAGLMWVDKQQMEDSWGNDDGVGVEDMIMFYGAKKIKIPGKDLQFESKFHAFLQREIKYGQTRIDRTIRSIQKGYSKAR
jgi:hypothetical protein